MTPDERRLLTDLLDRLRRAPMQQHDDEADDLIIRAMRERPDLPYLMAQTILMQDFALKDAQARITTLERQGTGQPAPSGGGSFLGGLLNRGQPHHARGPWGGQPQAGYGGGHGGMPQPGGPWGTPGGGYLPGHGGGGGFMRSAAATAAGVVGGALLLNSLGNMFGPDVVVHEHLGDGGLGETGVDPAAADAGDAGGDVQPADYQDPGGDVGTDAGGDFGGGDEWV